MIVSEASNSADVLDLSQVTTANAVYASMMNIAPFHKERLDLDTYVDLQQLTEKLIDINRSKASAEFDHYTGTSQRKLEILEEKAEQQFSNKSILVTGGTGLIGSALIGELTKYNPATITSYSRGETATQKYFPQATYMFGDIRDENRLAEVFDVVKPDFVFHVAADKYNHYAESRVKHTLSTNIKGTQNVLEAAEKSGVSKFIYASTGKATRPFSPDIYASSKKTGEWLVSEAAAKGNMICSAGRFTHVVDNSYLINNLFNYINEGRAVSIHDPETMFYVQSALESANLLINSSLGNDKNQLTINAIRNLGLPLNLGNIGLGAIIRSGIPAAMYIKGIDPGYEEKTWPALYHPSTAGDVSPLINAIESFETTPSETSPDVDEFPMLFAESDNLKASYSELIKSLGVDIQARNIRDINNDLSWSIIKARLEKVPTKTLIKTMKHVSKVALHSERHEEHDRLNDLIICIGTERLSRIGSRATIKIRV